jgi:hypothetical protein
MEVFWRRSWKGMAGVSRKMCKVKVGNYGHYLSMPAFQTPVKCLVCWESAEVVGEMPIQDPVFHQPYP